MELRIVPDPPEHVWMKKSGVAKYLNVSERTIDQWRVNLGLPCWKIGKLVRFDRNEIDEWISTQFDDPLATKSKRG